MEFGIFQALGSRMDVVVVEGLSSRINKGDLYVYTLRWDEVESTTCRRVVDHVWVFVVVGG